MAGIRITNCHIHTFTSRHIPRWYPHPAVALFRSAPILLATIARVLRLVGQIGLAETLERLCRFRDEAYRQRQAEILAQVRPQYPEGTRFVVLPMDMAPSDHGPVRDDIRAQHDELAALAADPAHGGCVIPFATIHPDRPGAADEVERCIEDLGFRGLKLYPRLGFSPCHPVLMDRVYPYLVARGLPVMTHCSRGGVRGRGLVAAKADRFTDPAAYVPVLDAFPGMRLCLAHFGGQADWRSYVDDGIAPGDPAARAANWQVAIRDMIASGKYPGLWTDISFTLFHFDDFIPFLRVFLQDEALSRRVLFGSDYYMTRQERLSERAVCFRLRNALGEDMFRRIAEENPEVWLGERPDPAASAAG